MQHADIQVQRSGAILRVACPTNESFASMAHALNGTYNDSGRTWDFDARDNARVRALLIDVFGTDGSPESPVSQPPTELPDDGCSILRYPDVREDKLPVWARGILSVLRQEILNLERERDEAVSVAELARGATNPDTAAVVVEGDGDALVGIPGDRPIVTFRQPDRLGEGSIEVSRERNGALLVEACGGGISVHPRTESSVRITVSP